jgi:phosphonate transport system substrate-binding protein
MRLKHFLAIGLLFSINFLSFGCTQKSEPPLGKLVVGSVTYDRGMSSTEQYERFKEYLAQQIRTYVELEPAFNELAAVEQVKRQAWSIVFAPPGLAAIAIKEGGYLPILPMQGRQGLIRVRCVIVVRQDSPIQNLAQLSGKAVALGKAGSATGYYLPLYDLYGLTLRELRFAPTPKTGLEWLAKQEVEATALSEDEFQLYGRDFTEKFRVIHSTRFIPSGVVMLNPSLTKEQQEKITEAMKEATPNIARDAGYIPNANAPAYQQFIELVDKVKPIEANINRKPAVLVKDVNKF